MSSKRFIPATSLEGGTPIGSSYLRTFWACPYMFFNQYIRPLGDLEDGGQLVGIQPRFRSRALSMGSMNHSFMEHLYRSGCRDGADTGEWDIDYAIEGTQATKTSVKDAYEDEAEWQEDYDNAILLGRYYVERYGSHGTTPDWPRFQVAFDGEGVPLIEREFSLDMGFNDYYVTSKPDIIMTRDGYLITRDHKTAARGWGQRRAANIHTDPQFTMEHMILSELFPEEAFEGSEVNIIVKGLVSTTKAERFFRNTTTRSMSDVASFKADTIDLLERIDQAVANFQELYESTGDLELSAGLAFPRHGVRTDNCHAFNRACDFIDLCMFKDNIGNNLGAFKPRRVARTRDNGES